MEAAELESEGDIIPAMNAQSQTVRKNISLKLKGKGRGRGGRKGGRGKKEQPSAPAVVVKLEPKEEDGLKENLESEPLKFDEIEEDIFKLEAPTFTTIDRGPPEPVHRNVKLRWDYKVHLIGTKMMNPLIHCCKKCSLPILSYGRMIPCKHVFCYECGLKSEKLCPRCEEKVSRVEQVGLGQLFMCIYGALRRNGSDGCCRTYLSQRDLQAHINHRHLRQPVPASTSSMTAPSSAPVKGSANDSGSNRSSSASTTTSHHHSGPPPDYRMRSQSRNQAVLEPYRVQLSGSIMQQQQPPSQMGSFSADVHRNYERPNPMSAPPPIMSPYSLAVVSQSLSSVGVPPPICVPVATVAGAVAVSAYGSSPIPVVSVAPSNVVQPTRTNLITVPIHDDSAAGTPPTEYIPNYHQRASVPPPVPQPNYLQQMVAPPYSTPPPVSYPATYCSTPTIVTTFTPHYPPPPIYSSQVPPPSLTHHQGPPRFMAPPPQRYNTPSTAQAQYEDHSHLGSPQYPPPPSPWPAQQRTSGPPPQHQLPLGPPPTARPPFY